MNRLLLAGLVAAGLGGTSVAQAGGQATRRTAVVRAIERVAPAVVGVRVKMAVQAPQGGNPFDLFFRDFSRRPPPSRVQTVSQGSGVIIDPAGYVVTNYHVIAGGDSIEIELVDERTFPATVVGSAPDHDLAVLKVDSRGKLPAAPLGSSDGLMIGETVIAIGSPFGLSHTVTTGVVSALHRTLNAEDRTYTDFIQTDAAINPGNSGGALLNIEGALIGVNTAIYGKAQGIGFAIPIDKAKRIVIDLVRHGEVRRPYYGFQARDLDPKLAAALPLADGRGAVIAEIEPDGPSSAVLRDGDVITKVGGTRVDDAEELRVLLGDYTVGARIALELLRDGKPMRTNLKPGELSAKAALVRLTERTGLHVLALSAEEAQRLGLPGGVIAVESVTPGSAAARVGVVRGYLIRAVDSQRVLGLDELGKALARSHWRGRVNLLIQNGRLWQEIAFPL